LFPVGFRFRALTCTLAPNFVMQPIVSYQQIIEERLKAEMQFDQPTHLYEPIEYILGLGGKRLRPVLTLMAADIFGTEAENAVDAALAVEVFHNFSLVHDDIMDGAPLRRGKVTVHEKWDVNTGILSGDAMLILAYRFFERYEPETFQQLAKLFSKTALEVCEGQQWDVDFESRDDVSQEEYLNMIRCKTAVLVGAALQMGAIVAKTSPENCKKIYDFGVSLGMAFQLQDDYLDAFGDPATFGKQVGGDIIENKKTYLYLKALEFADDAQSTKLRHLFSIRPDDPTQKIEIVREVFESTGAANETALAIRSYTYQAFEILESMDISPLAKEYLETFGRELMSRKV
jgi:geranylgeranyl diphosphate synthase type II